MEELVRACHYLVRVGSRTGKAEVAAATCHLSLKENVFHNVNYVCCEERYFGSGTSFVYGCSSFSRHILCNLGLSN